MKKSSHELFMELETLALNLEHATGFNNSAATLSIGGDFEIPANQWEASTALIHKQAEQMRKTLYEYWNELKKESQR